MTRTENMDPDKEVEMLVNPATAYRRRLAEEQARERNPFQAIAAKRMTRHGTMVHRLGGMALRAVPGAAALGLGIVELIPMGTAVAGMIISFAWAFGSIRRKVYV